MVHAAAMTETQPRQRRLAGKVKLVKVDVDKAPKVSERVTIQAVPTLILMRDGKVVAGRAGAAPASAVRSRMDEVLRSEA
jgi:thioredoxin 2